MSFDTMCARVSLLSWVAPMESNCRCCKSTLLQCCFYELEGLLLGLSWCFQGLRSPCNSWFLHVLEIFEVGQLHSSIKTLMKLASHICHSATPPKQNQQQQVNQNLQPCCCPTTTACQSKLATMLSLSNNNTTWISQWVQRSFTTKDIDLKEINLLHNNTFHETRYNKFRRFAGSKTRGETLVRTN
jgi:hypothetical protein